ncbi:MAG: minichromosome maintenance protein MCM [Candidatus Thermoplasmatota archaeon]|nr:minichromosome maintenance protein MCM [Candidatus Thermoplasmatota archaeon]
MENDIALDELMELWRSFFQDSRNRPVDKFGKDFSAPKCSTCKGEGKIEILSKGKLDENEPTEKICPNCKGERVDSDSIPTYGDEIQKVAREYPDGERAIRVTWESVSDFNARLSSNLRWNLDEALDAAKNIVQEFIDEETKKRVRKEHRTKIALDVVPMGIPGELYDVEISGLRKEHLYRTVRLRGLVRKATPVRPRMEIGLFECDWERHRNSYIQDFFTLEKPIRCTAETCKCTEFKLRDDLSQFIDSQKVEIQEYPEELPPGAQPERLTAYFESSLAHKIQPGDRVAIVGIIKPKSQFQGRRQKSEFDIYIYTHSIDERIGEDEEIEPTASELIEIKELATQEDIAEKIRDSISPTIYGMEWEKRAMALQQFGGVDKELPDGTRIRGDIHMLMMGDPGLAKSQLLRSAARIAPRGVMATGKSTSAAGLTAAAVRDEFGEGRWSLEAGTLVLASGGIACIDEIDKMSDEDRSSMHEAMEQQTISIAKAGINAQLKSKCSVLAAANPRRSRFDMTMPLPPQVNMPISLLSRFDIFFIITDNPEPEKDDLLADRILESHRAGEVLTPGDDTSGDELAVRTLEGPINSRLLKLYISYAKRLRPVMSTQAQRTIKEYYTGLRKRYHNVDDQDKTMPITPRQLESIIRLAEADAKLYLSDTVDVKHVDHAIDLMNLFLSVTLRGDVDYAFSGMDAEHRKKEENPSIILMEIIGPAGGVDEEEIYDIMAEKGFSRNAVEKHLSNLRTEGRLLKDGYDKWRRG